MVNKEELIEKIIKILKRYKKPDLDNFLNNSNIIKGGSKTQISLCHNIAFPKDIKKPLEDKLVYPSSLLTKGTDSTIKLKFKEFAIQMYILYKVIYEKINPKKYVNPDFIYKYVCSYMDLPPEIDFEVFKKSLVLSQQSYELNLIKDFLQELFKIKEKLTINFIIKEQKIYFTYKQTEYYLFYSKNLNRIHIIMNIKKQSEQRIHDDFINILDDKRGLNCPACPPCMKSTITNSIYAQPLNNVSFWQQPTKQPIATTFQTPPFSYEAVPTLTLTPIKPKDPPKTDEEIKEKYKAYLINYNRHSNYNNKDRTLLYVDTSYKLDEIDFNFIYNELDNDDLLKLWLLFTYLYKYNYHSSIPESRIISYNYLYNIYSNYSTSINGYLQNIDILKKAIILEYQSKPSVGFMPDKKKQLQKQVYDNYIKSTIALKRQFNDNEINIIMWIQSNFKKITNQLEKILHSNIELTLLNKLILYIIDNFCVENLTAPYTHSFIYDSKKYSFTPEIKFLFAPIVTNYLITTSESNIYYEIVKGLLDHIDLIHNNLKTTPVIYNYKLVNNVKLLRDDNYTLIIEKAKETNIQILNSIIEEDDYTNYDDITIQFELFNKRLNKSVNLDLVKDTGLTMSGFIILCNLILFVSNSLDIIRRIKDNGESFQNSDKFLKILKLKNDDFANQGAYLSNLTIINELEIILTMLGYKLSNIIVKALIIKGKDDNPVIAPYIVSQAPTSRLVPVLSQAPPSRLAQAQPLTPRLAQPSRLNKVSRTIRFGNRVPIRKSGR